LSACARTNFRAFPGVPGKPGPYFTYARAWGATPIHP
jgi:hypothetical protein